MKKIILFKKINLYIINNIKDLFDKFLGNTLGGMV